MNLEELMMTGNIAPMLDSISTAMGMLVKLVFFF